MSSVKVYKSSLRGLVNAMPSKSYTHRILICSAFSDKPVKVKGLVYSNDVLSTLNCITALGAEVETFGGECLITPVKRVKNGVLKCGESGSTLRFMLAVAAALGGEHIFTGEGRLPERPVAPLIKTLVSGGITVKGEGLPLTLSGKLRGGFYNIDGEQSSQFLSGLLLAAPLTGEDVHIEAEGKLNSFGYVDITLDVMEKFGIKTEVYQNGYFIKGGQKYVSPEEIAVEGDWSNAAFALAGGLLTGEVSVAGLLPHSRQGDKAVTEVFKLFGGEIGFENGVYVAKKSVLKGANVNVENIIDAAPIISVLAAFAEGNSVISGVGRLRLKESDRLEAVKDLINGLGGFAEIAGDALLIKGRSELPGGNVSGRNDHRIVMAAVTAGARCGARVADIEAVKKSYPAFFEDYLKIGGVFDAE